MIRLELTQEEADYLLKLLQYYHSELRMEIADTDAMKFREQLKTEKRQLKNVREKLEQLIAAEAPPPTAAD